VKNIYIVRFSANYPNHNYRGYQQGYEAFHENGSFCAAINNPGDIIILLKTVLAESGTSACFKLREWQSNGKDESWLTEEE